MHFSKGLDFIANEFYTFSRARYEEYIVFDMQHIAVVNLVYVVGYNRVFHTMSRAIEENMGDFLILVEIIEFPDNMAMIILLFVELHNLL